MNLKFRNKLILLVLVILLIAGTAYLFVTIQLAKDIESDIVWRLTRSNETYEEFNANYFSQLILQSVSVSDNPKFAALLSTQDRATISEGLMSFNENLQADVFVAMSRSGEILASADSQIKANTNMVQVPEVSAALEGNDNGGFWEDRGRLIRVAASPTIVANEVLGAIVLGYELNDSAAVKIAKVTTSQIAFMMGGRILATNLPGQRPELTEQLQKHKESLDHAMIHKGPSPAFTFELEGEQFLAVASPVFASPGSEGQDKRVIATYVFFSSLDRALRPLRESQEKMLYIGLGVAAVALMIGFVIATGVTKPVKSLVGATRAVATGNLDYEIRVTSRDEMGELAIAFNEMTKGLKQKERVEGLFGKYLSPDVAKKVLAEQSVDGILKGEKVRLSVMFTDIRGFTPMSRGMDPQELIHLLNSHFDEMIDIIDRYGGTVDKFIGDAIMAFFGAPVHYDDFHMRALHAAVQMQRASEKFNFQRRSEGKDPIHVGIGINTGEVVVGNIGSNKRLEYTVIGETVNIANRLCSVAKKGQIIISQSTYDLLPSKNIAAPIEQVVLKGVAEPVTVYEVLLKS